MLLPHCTIAIRRTRIRRTGFLSDRHRFTNGLFFQFGNITAGRPGFANFFFSANRSFLVDIVCLADLLGDRDTDFLRLSTFRTALAVRAASQESH